MANASQAWMINAYDMAEAPGWTLGGIRDGSVVDAIAALFSTIFVHVRGLPMFSTLLGFGIGLIAASMWRKGYPQRDARRVLLRRYGFLALFGLAHMFLLFYGDIMLYYGLIGIVVAMLFTLSNRWLRIIAYTALLINGLFGTASAVAMYYFQAPMEDLVPTPVTELTTVSAYYAENFWSSLVMLVGAPFAVLQLGGLVLIGYVWAREGYLVNAAAHRGVLVRWVILGAAVALLIGIPWGLAAIGVLDPYLEGPLMVLNSTWGVFTGPAILAAIALATEGIQQRMAAGAAAPAWTGPFVALGKRSMSGYLAQSFLFIAAVMPFTLGIGLESSVTGKLLVGLCIWLITLVLAVVLERTGTPGPFEQGHRRLSYGKTKRLEPFALRQSQ